MMSRPDFTTKKVRPLTPVKGNGRPRKLILKAANDNRAPLSVQLKSFAFITAPILAIVFFTVIWWLR